MGNNKQTFIGGTENLLTLITAGTVTWTDKKNHKVEYYLFKEMKQAMMNKQFEKLTKIATYLTGHW